MDTPGYDPPCTTGLIAGGANVLVFTTGRGSVLGLKPTPCIKVATNTPMYERMVEDMDLDAGPILEGEAVESVGKRLFDLILDVASGKETRSEQHGVGEEEFAPWQSDPRCEAVGDGASELPASRRGGRTRSLGDPVLVILALVELSWLLWCLIVPLTNVNKVDVR